MPEKNGSHCGVPPLEIRHCDPQLAIRLYDPREYADDGDLEMRHMTNTCQKYFTINTSRNNFSEHVDTCLNYQHMQHNKNGENGDTPLSSPVDDILIT